MNNRALLWALTAASLTLSCSDGGSSTVQDLGGPDGPPGALDLEAGPDLSQAPDLPSMDLAPTRPDGSSNMGAACTTDHHCTVGLVCDTSMPGGLCTRSCKADAE